MGVKIMARVTNRRFILSVFSLLMTFLIVFSYSMIGADAATTLTGEGAAEIKSILSTKLPDQSYTATGGTVHNDVSLNKLYYYDDNGRAKTFKLFTQSGNTFTFNTSCFEKAPSDLQQDALSVFVREVNSSSVISNSDKNKIYDEIKNNCSDATAAMVGVLFEDNKADLFSALKLFSPFNGIIGSVLGVGVLLIIVLLLGSTVFDLVYLGVPVARNYLTDKQDQKGGGKPWGITHEAWSVINEVEGGGGSGSNGKYRNAYILYFKRRIITYIVLSICILYLLSGQIAGIISWLMNLVSGFSL